MLLLRQSSALSYVAELYTIIFNNHLAFPNKLWQSTNSVGERPMINKTQISMRRLERPGTGCTGRRAWFVDYC
jgi:hypothetical protein